MVVTSSRACFISRLKRSFFKTFAVSISYSGRMISAAVGFFGAAGAFVEPEVGVVMALSSIKVTASSLSLQQAYRLKAAQLEAC